MLKITVFVSGGGGNLRAIIENENHLKLYRVIKVVSERECGAILVAQKYKIDFQFLKKLNPENYLQSIPHNTDLVVLAGYMPIVPAIVCNLFSNRMINTHPSLLPKFGGKGMYGVNVQRAVLAAGEEYAGCTVHYVNEKIDEGRVIAQSTVRIPAGIDAWELGGVVHKLENSLLPEIISRFATGDLP